MINPWQLSNKVRNILYAVLGLFVLIPTIIMLLRLADLSKSFFHYETKNEKIKRIEINNKTLKDNIDNLNTNITKNKELEKIKTYNVVDLIKQQQKLDEDLDTLISVYKNKLNDIIKNKDDIIDLKPKHSIKPKHTTTKISTRKNNHIVKKKEDIPIKLTNVITIDKVKYVEVGKVSLQAMQLLYKHIKKIGE